METRAYAAAAGDPPLTYKIIVVNDGSKDGTGAIPGHLALTLPVIPLHHAHGWHGNALLNGYAHALTYHPRYVFQTDSDDQFSPADFGKLRMQRSVYTAGVRVITGRPAQAGAITALQ